MRSIGYQNKSVYLQHEIATIDHIVRHEVRYFFVLLALFSALPIVSQNYVKTETCLDENETRVISEYCYYDGLGRISVSASNGISPEGKYVYTMQTYDSNGREYERWLPSVGTTEISSPSYSDFQVLSDNTYNQDGYAYSANLYNVLDQVEKIESAGSAWRNANKHIQIRYGANAANEVKHYRAADGNSLVGTEEYYPTGTLTMEETTDEDGRTNKVYKDFLERTILERSITGDSIYDTYYVYDSRNQLCFVLTPEFQRAGWKDLYAYEYRYDGHGNMVKKIQPHCHEEQIYYDHEGRIVYTKDAVGRYKFFFYDNFGRQVIRGTCSNFNYHHYQNVSMSSSENGFMNTGYQYAYPSAITHPKFDEVKYYDNYSFLTKNLYSSSSYAPLMTMQNPTNAAGLLTGRAIRTSSDKILLTVFYYDDFGRLTDQRETLLNGGFRQTISDLSFTGKPLSETTTLIVNGITTFVTKTYEYCATNDQPTKMTISYNGGSPVTVAEYEYNDLGKLSKVKRGGLAGETSYNYNLRGWTTSITGNGFSEWLYYTDGKGIPYYGGNISSQLWQVHNEGFKRGYKFFYDGLGRITKAEYAEGDNMNTHVGRYTEWIKDYTFSSAIRKIERYGRKDGNSYGKIDNLRMYYSGMQISKVKEDANPVTYTGAFDYTSDIIGEEPAYTQYEYYDDGSLKWDAAKGLSLISYNRYNTPNSVQFSNGNRTEYVYSSTGERLRTIYYTAVPNITVPIGSTISLNSSNTLSVDSINYYGEFIFENGQLSKYLFNGGYATIANGQPTYHYYEQDHLGNNRAVISHSGTVEQVTHYYPFGAVYGDAGSNDALQRYKYNGKELDRMHGLNFYDYGVRQYDPLLCRFTQVDPLAEKYYSISPYAYCGNNPVNRIDPDGRDWVKTQNNDYVWMDNVATVEDVPDGYTYIGKTGNDILYDLNINTYFEAQTSVGGSMGIDGDDRFGGVFSGNTYGLTGIADVSAVIDTNVKNGTLNNSMGISFKGVKFEVIFNQKGYSSNDNFSLEYRGNMRLQMNDMNVYIPLKYSRDLQVQPKGSVSLSASRFFKADELKRNILFREIGIEVGATNSTPIFIKPASFTWNLMRTPIIRRK